MPTYSSDMLVGVVNVFSKVTALFFPTGVFVMKLPLALPVNGTGTGVLTPEVLMVIVVPSVRSIPTSPIDSSQLGIPSLSKSISILSFARSLSESSGQELMGISSEDISLVPQFPMAAFT